MLQLYPLLICLYRQFSVPNQFSNPVSDWLKFCCENLILYQKKIIMKKKAIFMIKNNNENARRVYESILLSELA